VSLHQFPSANTSFVDPPGGGGDNGDMEARVTKLETIAEKTSDRLVVIEKDIAIIKSQMDGFTKHYATKADLTEAKNSIIMWVVSAILLAQLLPTLLKKFGI
jgi:hypothetical protein